MDTVLRPDDLRPQRPGGLGVGALLALLTHAGLIVALAFGVNWRTSEPQGVTAELWSQVPQTAAPPLQETPVAPPPQPKPQPKPVDPPPAPDNREAEIAIEKAEKAKKQREAQQKAEQEAREREQQAKADAEKKKQLEKQQALEDQKRQKAEDLAREKARQDQLKRLQGMMGGTGAPDSAGTAQQSAGPSASYAGRIVARIRPNIVLTDDVPGNPDAVVEVRAAPDGSILGRRLVKSSGVKAWDDAVLRAVDRTDTLPRDVDGRVPGTITIVFRPQG